MAKAKDKKNPKKIEKKPAKKAEKSSPVAAKLKGAASKIVKAVQKAVEKAPEKKSDKKADKRIEKNGSKVVASKSMPTKAAKGKNGAEKAKAKVSTLDKKNGKKEELEKKSALSEVSTKAQAPKKGEKLKKAKKKEEGDESDDLVGDVDDFGPDELSEYESELESAEASESEEVAEWTEESVVAAGTKEDDEIILTDAEGRRYCRVRDCDQIAAVDSYCRYHYLLLWKKIQVRKKILADGKLERYIDELTSRYPDKFLDVIRRDLRTEKDFISAIQELEIDESGVDADFEEENTNYLDEVRGATEGGTLTEDDDF